MAGLYPGLFPFVNRVISQKWPPRDISRCAVNAHKSRKGSIPGQGRQIRYDPPLAAVLLPGVGCPLTAKSAG